MAQVGNGLLSGGRGKRGAAARARLVGAVRRGVLNGRFLGMLRVSAHG